MRFFWIEQQAGDTRKNNVKIPFKDLDADAWRRLAITAIIAYYLIMVGAEFFQKNIYTSMGMDYLGFWSTGKVIDQQGFPHAYHLTELKEI